MSVRATHKQTVRDGKVVDETLTLNGNLGLYELAKAEVEKRIGPEAASTIRWVKGEAKFTGTINGAGEVAYDWQGDRLTVLFNEGDRNGDDQWTN